VRISVQLVDAARGRQVWSERYDRPTALIIHAEEDITQKVIGTLVARIEQSEYRRIARKPAANWSAYDFYLRGNAIMRNAPKDRTGAIVAAARQAYEHSLAFDAKYAPALQGLALTYWTAWLKPLKDARLRGEFRNPQALERSEQLARDAIDADPTRAEAWAALGWIQYWRHGPRAGLAAYERAFALNPNLVDGRYALLLAPAGRTQEATFYMKRAMRYDPLYPLRYEYYLGLSYYLAGRSSDALTPLGKAARGLRGFPTGYPVLAAAAASAGNMEAARNASSQVRRLWPKFSTARFVRFMRLERKQDASRLAAALKKAGLPE